MIMEWSYFWFSVLMALGGACFAFRKATGNPGVRLLVFLLGTSLAGLLIWAFLLGKPVSQEYFIDNVFGIQVGWIVIWMLLAGAAFVLFAAFAVGFALIEKGVKQLKKWQNLPKLSQRV